MPRRASSKPNPLLLIAIAAGVVLAVLIGKSVLDRKPDGVADGKPLDMDALLENGHMLRGNEYSVEGSVHEKLQWTPDRGQVISLLVDTPGGNEFVAIEVPPTMNSMNIEIRQRYSFLVRFRDGGIAVAQKIIPL
ncbi:MAG: hypothetical protein ACO3RV_04120 [Luteolibacter sp.]